jgi:hypothetical protein
MEAEYRLQPGGRSLFILYMLAPSVSSIVRPTRAWAKGDCLMFRSLIAVSCLALAIGTFTSRPVLAQAPAAGPAAISAADAAPFLGDWTLTLESPMGQMIMTASLKSDAGKVTGEVGSEQMGKSPVAEMSKQGANLLLHYSFDYQGQMIPAVVTLTPAGEKVNVNLDIAGGAFVATGTAAKAVKP